jgi:hypothetical protein
MSGPRLSRRPISSRIRVSCEDDDDCFDGAEKAEEAEEEEEEVAVVVAMEENAVDDMECTPSEK